MRRPFIHSILTQPVRARLGKGIIQVACVCLLAIVGPAPARASESVVLRQGGSTVLSYHTMKRVAIVDPAVADVVVSSLSELIVIGKAPGQTKIYVWDSAGRHEMTAIVSPAVGAREIAKALEALLDPSLRVKVLDDKTLVVEGQLHSQGDVDRAHKIIKAQPISVQIVDLVDLEGASLTPAERRAAALKKLIGPDYEYVLWDNDTVVVQGQAKSPEEAERVRKLVEAGAKDFKAESLVTYPGEKPNPQELAASITKMLGPGYKAWPMGGKQIVVEGRATDEDTYKRTKSLLTAFAKNAEIVDLTAEAPQPKIEDRVKMLQTSFGAQIKVRSLENRAIVVEGAVTTPEIAANYRKLIAAVGQQVPVVDLLTVVPPAKRQIIVRVRIAEVDKTFARNLGITWGTISNSSSSSSSSSGSSGPSFNPQPILVNSKLQTALEYAFSAQAQVNNGNTRLLAEPNLAVNDGEDAKLTVGGEIPIPIAQAGGTGAATITIDYKQYGVILDITPKILPDGSIEVKLHTEQSSLDYANGVNISGFVIPGLDTRTADTILTMKDKATLLLGGLIQNNQSRSISKIPVLGDLPILGQLFRSEQFQTNKTDLIIMVTPEVMK